MSYYSEPKTVKPADMANYVLVTPLNLSEAKKMGRTFYVIERSGNLIHYCGFFTIRPRLVKCKMQMTNHPFLKDSITWIPDDESEEDYKTSFGTLINQLLEQNKLYIKLKDTLTKYTRI